MEERGKRRSRRIKPDGGKNRCGSRLTVGPMDLGTLDWLPIQCLSWGLKLIGSKDRILPN